MRVRVCDGLSIGALLKVIVATIAVAAGLIAIKAFPKMSGTIFVIYLGGIIYFTFLQRLSLTLERNVFEPFLTGMKAVRGFKNLIEAITSGARFYGEIFQVMQDAALNLLMFMPFGYLLPTVILPVNTAWKVVGVAFLFSLLIEITQQISKLGMFDAFDLVLNTLGAVVGWKLSRVINSSLH